MLTLRGPRTARRGGQLLDLGLIEDGSVLIEGGLVRHVGPTRRVENLAEARHARVICAEGRVVMPGFVDSHTHLVSGHHRPAEFTGALVSPAAALRRDAREVLAVLKSVRAATGRRLESDARAVLQGCRAHGTTSIEAKSGCGLDPANEFKILKVLGSLQTACIDMVPSFFGGHVVPPEFEDRPQEYVRLVCDSMLPEVAGKQLAQFADVCCDVGGLDEQQTRQILRAARAHGMRVKVHASQYGPSDGAKLAVEYGAVSVDHMDHGTSADWLALAQSDTIATLLPASGLRSSGPSAPARKMIDAGVAVALGTNYSTWDTPGYSMQTAIALACQQLRMAPAEAVAAATVNGAHALGIQATAGSLEPGKRANVLILKTPDYRDIAYTLGVNLVEKTIWRGQIVHE